MNEDSPIFTLGLPAPSPALAIGVAIALMPIVGAPLPVMAAPHSVVATLPPAPAPVPIQVPRRDPADTSYAPRLHTYEHSVQPVAADGVRYYGAPLRLLEVEGGEELRELALHRGLSWTLRLLDSDHTLLFMAGDALEMLHELTVSAPESVLARAAGQAIRVTAARMAEEPAQYFTPNSQGRWQFIAVIRLMLVHGVDVHPFQDFYEEHFPAAPGPYEDLFYGITFEDAVRRVHLGSMGNHLTYTSFLHFLVRDYPESGFDLPDDDFPTFLAQLTDFSYPLEDDGTNVGVAKLAEEDYFATHLAMMLTNWGEEPLPPGAVTRELVPALREYIDRRYDRVRLRSRDLVLFAEFVEALRLLELREGDRISLGEEELLARQHEDGSWGAETEATITENPYTALHPTWAAMAALRHRR